MASDIMSRSGSSSSSGTPVETCSSMDPDSSDSVKTLQPLGLSITAIRSAIDPQYFQRNTLRGVLYLARDLCQAALLFIIAYSVHKQLQLLKNCVESRGPHENRWTLGLLDICVDALFLTYWWFQGLTFTGLWVIGHECGHGAFSPNSNVCDVLGFIIHSALWTPYFSWKISHHRHHVNHASMERDEVYVPNTRSDLNIPNKNRAEDVSEYFQDTPLYTLASLIGQQFLAFPAYLTFNVSGQKWYPKWTNHFDPRSILFKKDQAMAVMFSNFGLLVMVIAISKACQLFGFWNVVVYYGIPWLMVTHWFIMITYLHHTAPHIPHYRQGSWTFVRGAAATTDRDFLGWQGRFFLHDVAHFHVVHHFFPKIPFYHTDAATQQLKNIIGEHYLSSNQPIFSALWESYNECQFVEDEGDTIYYKNRKGKEARFVH